MRDPFKAHSLIPLSSCHNMSQFMAQVCQSSVMCATTSRSVFLRLVRSRSQPFFIYFICRKLHDPGNVQMQSYTMPLTAMSEVGVGVVDPVASASVYSARLQSWIRWQISQLSDLSGCCCLMQQPKTLLQADRHGNGFIEKRLLGMHILIIHSSIISHHTDIQEMIGNIWKYMVGEVFLDFRDSLISFRDMQRADSDERTVPMCTATAVKFGSEL